MRRGAAAVLAAIAATASAGAPRVRADDAAPAPADPAPADPAPAAEPPPPPAEKPIRPRLPKITEASGVDRPAETPTSHHLLWIPRAILFVPRWTIWLAAQPLRLAAWTWEHYQIRERFKGVFFNVDETFGVFPTALFETGFGLNVGARLLHKDMFGRGERISLRAGVGGRYQQIYAGELRTGERLGNRVAAGVEVRYERRPRDRFFGIGNADRTEPVPGMPLVDPSTEDTAIASRYRETLVRAVVTLDAPITPELTAKLSTAYMNREFGSDPEAENAIGRYYDTTRLTGFTDGVENLYIEGELRYDSRRPTSAYQSRAVDATGWLASVYGGGVAGLGGDPSDFFRYGGEVQRYLDLYRGSRVLALRVMVEATGGVNRDDDIAFVDLPRLGGNEYLRGYPPDRFRDRAATLFTAEYMWALGNFLSAYAFVDTGRVWHSLRDFELEEFRVGFGGGLQVQTHNSFLMRLQVAASRDGNVFFEVALSPSFERRERAGRF
jgi:outer membrane protein assembly factor BamA